MMESKAGTRCSAWQHRQLNSLPFVGRHAELRKLDLVFSGVVEDGVSQVVFLTSCGGGVGKTSLIREWRRQGDSFCCGGTFHRSGYAYSALNQVLDELVTELLNGEDDEACYSSLDRDFKETFESNTPMLSILLDTFPSLCDLIPHGWSTREWIDHSCRMPLLKRALTELIRIAVRHRTRPLVFVVEDVHEADSDSRDLVLHVIKSLLLDNVPNLLFIVSFDYQASRFVLGEPRLESQVTRMHLENMLCLQLETIVGHLLGFPENNHPNVGARFSTLVKWIAPSGKVENEGDDTGVVDLVERMTELTSGTVLEIIEFTSLLIEAGLLEHFGNNVAWSSALTVFDIDVRSLSSAQLLAKQRLLLLAERERATASIAACIGSEFRPELVQDVMQDIPNFQPLLHAGFLMVVQRDDYAAYRFAHESYKEAAYSLLDDELKRRFHRRIGESLKGNRDNLETDKTLQLVSIAEQLNLGRTATEDDVLDAAGLNLEAGRRMSERGAFEGASGLLSHGIQWLKAASDDMWTDHIYDLTLELHLRLAKILLASGKYEECKQFSDAVLDHARQASDTYQVRELSLHRLLVCKDYGKAMDMAIATLALLDERIPRRPRKLHLAKETYKVKRLLQKAKSCEGDAPSLFDPRSKMVLHVLLQLGEAAGALNESRLKNVAGLRALRLCLTDGRSNKFVPLVMAKYATLLAAQGAFEWSNIVSVLAEERHGKDLEATLALHTSVKHWTHPLQESVQPLKQAHRQGLEMGEEDAASSAFSCFVQIMFVVGTPLDGLLASIESTGAEPEGAADILRQVALYLSRGTVNQRTRDHLDHNFENSVDDHDLLVFRWTKMFLAYIFSNDNLEQHANALWDISSGIDRSTHFFRVPHAFYSALVAISLQEIDGGYRYRKIADKYVKMMEYWEKKKVPQVKHKLLILLAERDRLLKRKKLMDLKRDYDEAIGAANEAGNILDCALACQRCAVFCTDNREETWSEFYRDKTVAAYQEWGATAMTSRLRRTPTKPTQDPATSPGGESDMGMTVGITSESFRSQHGDLSYRGKHGFSTRSTVTRLPWSRAA